jgi:AcrR family transcriptional regulator
VDALSMRRVAAGLGAAPMSLYNHLPNKAALLDAVAEQIMSEVGAGMNPGDDWAEQTRQLARSFRNAVRRYPRSAQLVITRQPRSSVGLRPVELALGVVRGAGFDDQTSVRLVRTFVSFIMGSMLHEAGLKELDERPPSVDLDAVAGELEETHANVRAVLPMLVQHDHDTDFEFGLALLIGAMQGLRDGR